MFEVSVARTYRPERAQRDGPRTRGLRQVLSVPRGEAEDPKYSSVTAELDVTTLITGEPQRDEHPRSAGRTR